MTKLKKILWIIFSCILAFIVIRSVIFFVPEKIEITEKGYFTNVTDAEYRQSSEEKVTFKGTLRGKWDLSDGIHYEFNGDVIFENHPDMSLTFTDAVIEKNINYRQGEMWKREFSLDELKGCFDDKISKGNILLSGSFPVEQGKYKRTDYDILINKKQGTINVYLSYIDNDLNDDCEVAYSYYFDGGASSYEDMEFMYHIKPE